MLNAKYSVLHGGEPTGNEVAAWAEVKTLFDDLLMLIIMYLQFRCGILIFHIK